MTRLKKRNLIYIAISVAVNLLLAAIAIFVFGVRYSTDDDVSMTYIAYGIYMNPSSRIVFSNVIFGWLMKTFFAIKSTINWQVVLYFAGLCAAGFVSLYEVMKRNSVKLYLLWTIFVSCFFYNSYVSITFTVVAAYICCQGLLAFFLSIQEQNIKSILLSGLVIAYGSLIRFESVMAISMFAAVSWTVIVASFVLSEGSFDVKSIAKKYVWPFVFLYALIGVLYLGDKVAYMPKEWASYYEYNLLRGEVLDDCSVINMNDFESQKNLGISQAEAESLNEWYFNDPEVFNKELFSKIDKVSTELRGEYIKHPISDMFFAIKNIICVRFMMIVSLVTVCVLTVFSLFEKRKNWWVKAIGLLLSIIPFLVQIFAYCFMGRYSDVQAKELPVRIVEITIMGFFICFIMIDACFENKEDGMTINFKVIPIMLGISLFFSVGIQAREYYEMQGFSLKSESMIEKDYSFLNDGHVYIMEFRALQAFMQEYRVWQNPPQGYLNNCVILGGCEVNYPYLVQKQNALRVSNPYKSLYTNDNVYLASVGYPEIELNYLRDVYDKTVDCELVMEHGVIDVYRFYRGVK